MATNLKHHSRQREVSHVTGHTTMFVGGLSPEQSPHYCNRCGMVVALVYRVYDRNKLTGAVVKGQYEVAHLDTDTGDVLSWECTVPGILAEYTEKARQAITRDTARHWSGSNVVHLDQGDRVACGAGGELNVTTDHPSVTCNNCVRRMNVMTGMNTSSNKVNQATQPTKTTTMTTEDDDMSTVVEDNKTKGQLIKERIAAAKAKAQAAKTGKAANLTEPATNGDAGTNGEAPMPKATVTKKAVKAAAKVEKVAKEKVARQPKMLNACGCGCLQPCQSRFLPGHDAKFHSMLKRISDGRLALDDEAVPDQVRDGMFAGVTQKTTKTKVEEIVTDPTTGKDKKVVKVVEALVPVAPKVSEAEYLESLKGMGGPASEA